MGVSGKVDRAARHPIRSGEMATSDHDIRLLHTAEEMAAIVTVLQQIWGSITPIVSVELLKAVAHGGGYVAAAFDGGHVVGASFGFLARYDDDSALHSHVTGVLPGVQHSGVGRAMKNHQRSWAANREIPWITWTFDPLVRRNAWFNIEVLGCRVAEYLTDFYGPMTDSINNNDASDRLLVAWPTGPTPAPVDSPAAAQTIEVATPDDIVSLRRTDPAEVARWRMRVRAELGERLGAGATVTGFTRSGSYVLQIAHQPEAHAPAHP